jgi:hypothetical protein
LIRLPEKWKNISNKVLMIGKSPSKMLVEKCRGEYWPENDPTMSLEDARFLLRYFAAEIQNAYGPMFMILEVEKF